MIVKVTEENLLQAARVHAKSWRESHRGFCTPEFVAAHTTRRQAEFLRRELETGKRVWMLIEDRPVGIVSVWGSLIENLYILPEEQGKGWGSKLLSFAQGQCSGVPTLWIRSNNRTARAFYLSRGWRFTGVEKALAREMAELEMKKWNP